MKKTVSAILFLFFGFVLFAQQKPDALREYRNGNFERSVEICRAEIASNPNNLESHVVICWSLISLRRYEEARTFALAGRGISRYDPRIIEILGEVYYFQGHNNDALRCFQEYVNLAPQGSRIDAVYYYIGELFIRLGKFYHADIALSTAVYYMPRNADWWARLGYARESAGEYAEAIGAYEKALALNARLASARAGLERTRQGNR
jgi:tetratricopeptide (TPR) repeat protein